MSCSTHIPEYDATVNETYCQVCLERLPNAPPADINPRLPIITRRRLVFIILGLLILWLWYPSQRDPIAQSPTPCWDVNQRMEDIELHFLDLDLHAMSCAPSGRFAWQGVE